MHRRRLAWLHAACAQLGKRWRAQASVPEVDEQDILRAQEDAHTPPPAIQEKAKHAAEEAIRRAHLGGRKDPPGTV